jgi:flagellar hook-basal body complex protein FliE
MAVLPAAAAAAYQSIANMGASATPTAGSAGVTGGGFGELLSNAMHDAVATMHQGEQAATQHMTGRADIVDVVNAVNQAELTLDTVVAVRDKVVSAYQSIMNMPI